MPSWSHSPLRTELWVSPRLPPPLAGPPPNPSKPPEASPVVQSMLLKAKQIVLPRPMMGLVPSEIATWKVLSLPPCSSKKPTLSQVTTRVLAVCRYQTSPTSQTSSPVSTSAHQGETIVTLPRSTPARSGMGKLVDVPGLKASSKVRLPLLLIQTLPKYL